jgi:multidrug efflux pump subunit AcrA (membrane-fusion protein)
MHPSYITTAPGDCPICNMALEPLKEDPGTGPSAIPGYANLTLALDRRQRIGIRTEKVVRRRLARALRLPGRVDVDERRIGVVSLKVGGFVEELRVRAVGETVRVGQPLLALWSPELLEVERAYQLAWRSRNALPATSSTSARGFADDTLAGARGRLLNWDVPEEHVRALEGEVEPSGRVTFTARVRGVVTRRDVARGASVMPGQPLLEVTDLSSVWVHAAVHERELPLVAVGAEAEIRVAGTVAPLTGRVVWIDPFVADATRTGRVRIEAPNPEGALRPGMFADVRLPAADAEALVVPDTAVLDTGVRQIAFVDRGEGRLEPREVTVGVRADGFAAIERGLAEGEVVVASGTFLVDSESRLRGSAFVHHGH